jgi:hypothetical protein
MNDAKHILVVDDEPDLRKLVSDFLTRNGYRVFEAHDGVAMMETMKSSRIDLVILDITMPGEDGLRQRSGDTSVAGRYPDVRRRIDGLSSQVHLEIQMRTRGDACSAHLADLLAGCQVVLSLGDRGRDHAEMAVNANEAVVLNQHFEPTWALVLDTEHRAGRRGYYRGAHWCR